MSYLTLNESRLYFESHGAGAPVVLLHGVGGNHASWFHQVQAWSESFQVISMDARGFGNSSDGEGLGRSAFTDDLLRLLDHLEIGRVMIVAQSMGGGTAVDFACRHSERVSALVLADTLVWLAPPPSMAQAITRQAEKTAGLSQLERVLGVTFQEAEPALSELYLQIASFNRYNFKTLPGEQARYHPSALAATGVPTCFVAGEEDILFPPDLIRQAREDVPGSEFIRLPHAGHSAYFEAADAFNHLVGEWLKRQADRAFGSSQHGQIPG